MCRRVVTCLVSAVALVAAGAACGEGARGRAGASKVARDYVEAYNRKDGEAMCAAFAPELRGWFERLTADGERELTCPEIAPGWIGYGEESYTPVFRRLEVLAVDPQVNGGTARVRVRARYYYKAYPKPLSHAFTDAIHLRRRSGGWEILKPGGVWFLTRSAGSPPASMLDPPIEDAEAHRPAPQPAASFECNGRPIALVDDPAGDAPSSLDVRQATVSVDREGSVCFRFSFASPPRPGTHLELRLAQDIQGDSRGRFRPLGLALGIGSRGRLHFREGEHSRTDYSRSLSAGWRRGELLLLWRAQEAGLDLRESVRFEIGFTRTLQFWEPLVNDPLRGTGGDPEGSGDRFEAPS
jgi:hypothetical protein